MVCRGFRFANLPMNQRVTALYVATVSMMNAQLRQCVPSAGASLRGSASQGCKSAFARGRVEAIVKSHRQAAIFRNTLG